MFTKMLQAAKLKNAEQTDGCVLQSEVNKARLSLGELTGQNLKAHTKIMSITMVVIYFLC